ncbi:MAG: hypothetical protein ACTSPF_09370 [Candidatus Heimdallarchaeaceae archaeon]
MSEIFCDKCGKEHTAKGEYCENCGTKIIVSKVELKSLYQRNSK